MVNGWLTHIKDTHRGNKPWDKTQTLTKIIDMAIWVICTVNQLFMKGSYIHINFSKTKVVGGKTPSFVIAPFCTSHSICFNTGFWQCSFVRKCCSFNCGAHSTKKAVLQIFEEYCFPENLLQSYSIENVKISSYCQVKWCRSTEDFQKSLVSFLEESTIFLLALK